MSPLTDTLDRVLNHRISLESRYASIVLPGLCRDRILEMTAQIPYRLPEEIIELYQWHNGTAPEGWDNFIPCFELISLERATDIYDSYCEIDFIIDANKKSYRHGLPIMNCNGDSHLIAIFGNDTYTAPIWCIDLEIGICEQCYDSLTAMAQTTVECFEEGLYWWNPEVEAFDSRNHKRYIQLHQKYNHQSTPLSAVYVGA
jgi:hypothetical protein